MQKIRKRSNMSNISNFNPHKNTFYKMYLLSLCI